LVVEIHGSIVVVMVVGGGCGVIYFSSAPTQTLQKHKNE